MNNFENSFNEPCKHKFWSMLDDTIYGYWDEYLIYGSAMFDVLTKILRAYRAFDPNMIYMLFLEREC